MFEESMNLISSGIGTAYPCAAVAVGVGHKVLARQFFGQRQTKPYICNITEDTLFDLASLSKLVSTTMVALKLIERECISLDDNIGKFLEYAGNYNDCNIRHLMTHTAGMPAGLPLFTMKHKDNDVLRTILDAPRLYPSGDKVVYSCMGYIVLQYILEKVGGTGLDRLAEALVFEPLGMKNACYNPSLLKKDTSVNPVAATEIYPHTGEWATGHVHDENAYFLGGVSGNAGVFAALDDMIFFAGMCSTKGIAPDGKVYLSEKIFDSAIRNCSPANEEARGLGFQLKGKGDFPGGSLFSEGSYGHTGFTGTSLYVDKETGLWGILLTNAIHYGRENKGAYFNIRRAFYDIMITEYKSSGSVELK